MRFQTTMAAMARNENHVAQFAEKMGWEKARAEATLIAYGTGKYFPDKPELHAMGATDSLYWAYIVALNAYHIDAVIQAGYGERLYTLLQKATVDKWRAGNAMPSQRNKGKIEMEFGIDMQSIPSECVFVYVVDENQKIQLDLRRSKLTLDGGHWQLVRISPDAYVVNLETDTQHFYTDAARAGLISEECGDFMRAVFPASKVSIYYVKP